MTFEAQAAFTVRNASAVIAVWETGIIFTPSAVLSAAGKQD
jgi:hypothetical protein